MYSKTLKVLLACLLATNMVMGQVTFSVSHAQNANGVSALKTYGYYVTLTAPGWVYSDNLGLVPGASPTAITEYVTLVTNTGGYAAVGVLVTSGAPGGNTGANCVAASTTHTSDVALKGLGTISSVCPADFITFYSAAPAAGAPTTTTTTPFASNPLIALNPLKWVFTPGATAATTACVATQVTPAVGTAVTKNSANTCGVNADQYFNQGTGSGAGAAAPTFAMYVELGPSGTNAEFCFQTAAQYALFPGRCNSSPIVKLSGFLAVFGILAAIFMN